MVFVIPLLNFTTLLHQITGYFLKFSMSLFPGGQLTLAGSLDRRWLSKFWSRITHFPVCIAKEFFGLFSLIFQTIPPWRLRAFNQYNLYFLESLLE